VERIGENFLLLLCDEFDWFHFQHENKKFQKLNLARKMNFDARSNQRQEKGRIFLFSSMTEGVSERDICHEEINSRILFWLISSLDTMHSLLRLEIKVVLSFDIEWLSIFWSTESLVPVITKVNGWLWTPGFSIGIRDLPRRRASRGVKTGAWRKGSPFIVSSMRLTTSSGTVS
jgi:hypothetical protein